MPRLLITAALLLLLTLPSLGHAASITNTFKTSSSGTQTIGVSDTIQYEVTVFADAGVTFNSILWSLSGDAADAITSTAGSGWAGVDNWVIDWQWHYSPPGSPSVAIGLITPGFVLPPPSSLPDRVSGPYGWTGAPTQGSGVPSLVGTVTLRADSFGTYQGGAFQNPGIDGFLGTGGSVGVSVSGGDFTVVPEPGTALLAGLGLCMLAARSRSTRA